VLAASHSPDGSRVLTAGEDGTARRWDAKTGAALATLKGHMYGVLAARFSADGSRVLTASQDGTARLWDAKTGAALAVFADHLGEVFDAAFSPDGTQVVTAGGDGLARIYSTQISHYVTRACNLLSGHSDRFVEVADVCKQVGVLRAP
jgi:WD40 repeat protein